MRENTTAGAQPGLPQMAWKALRLAKTRPGLVLRKVRESAHFLGTYGIRRLYEPPGVEFGPNVRLQLLSSVMAEQPGASIEIGAGSVVYEDCRIEAYGNGRITIGTGSILGGVRIVSRGRIELGERTLSSWNVFIQDFDPHPLDPVQRRRQVESMVRNFFPRFGPPAVAEDPAACEWSCDDSARPVIIGDDVWLGANTTVLKGAHIGSGSVVAAGAVVVAGSYPPNSVLAGVPARVVKALEGRTGRDLRLAPA